MLTKLNYCKLQSVAQQELKIIWSTEGESKASEKQLDAREMQETLEYIENKAASNWSLSVSLWEKLKKSPWK